MIINSPGYDPRVKDLIAGTTPITVDTTNFNNNLSAADNTVQKALDTIDNIVVPTMAIINGKLDATNGTMKAVYENIQSITTPSIVADVDALSTAQEYASSGNIILNGAEIVGGVWNRNTATLSESYQITFVSTGNDSDITFTITGIADDAATSEVVTGANAGTATSTKYFRSISSIAASGATDGGGKTVSVGRTATPRIICDVSQYNVFLATVPAQAITVKFLGTVAANYVASAVLYLTQDGTLRTITFASDKTIKTLGTLATMVASKVTSIFCNMNSTTAWINSGTEA